MYLIEEILAARGAASPRDFWKFLVDTRFRASGFFTMFA